MGFGKPNDEHNPPVPLHGHGEFAFSCRESGVAECGQISLGLDSSNSDFLSFPYMSNSPWDNIHASHQSYPHDPQTGNHLMAGLMRPDTLQSLQVDPSLSNLRGSLRNVDVCSSGFQNNQINVNFFPTGSKAAGGYQMNRQGGEAECSDMNWSQLRESSLNLGCGTSMSHHNTDFLEAGSNDVKSNSFQPRKVDGSFLTLGLGVSPGAGAKTKFDPREIASRLAEAVGPQSSSFQIQPATNLCHNLTNNFSCFQSNPGCFPSTVSKLGGLDGWTSSAMQGATVGMISNPYLNPFMPEAFKQHDVFENNDKNTGFMDKFIERHSAQESYKCSQGNPSSSSLLYDSTSTCLPHAEITKRSDLASETFEPTWISTQPTRDLLWNSHPMNPRGVSSSSDFHSSRHRENSVTQDYLGISMLPSHGSATEAVESGPRSISFQRDGQLSSAHQVNSAQAFGCSNLREKTSLQIVEGSAKKPETGASFPRRLGVQIDDDDAATQSASGSLLPMNMGVQTSSNEHQSQNYVNAQKPFLTQKRMGNEHQSRNFVPVQLTKNLLGPISGHCQDRLATQLNFQRPSLYTGQPQLAVAAQIPKDIPRVDRTAGQVLANPRAGRPSRVYGVIDQPSLKRRANDPLSVASLAQRRKLVGSHHSALGIPATFPPSTFASPHIRWAGFDSPPQPTGHRCMLCKRDLSFTPEGPVYQPSIPPAVAVLPCSHTFHDLCLQNITPDDQSKDPPCIPCAMGET